MFFRMNGNHQQNGNSSPPQGLPVPAHDLLTNGSTTDVTYTHHYGANPPPGWSNRKQPSKFMFFSLFFKNRVHLFILCFAQHWFFVKVTPLKLLVKIMFPPTVFGTNKVGTTNENK